MDYNEIKGDLIKLALDNHFDVIVHGCNCFNTQGSGIAKQMNSIFDTNNRDIFKLEDYILEGHVNKLGQIESIEFIIVDNKPIIAHEYIIESYTKYGISLNKLYVINAYTQYRYGTDRVHLDYEALRLCLRKINHMFTGKHLGLPQIGCGLAGGDWRIVKEIIQQELKDCKVTVVIYDK